MKNELLFLFAIITLLSFSVHVANSQTNATSNESTQSKQNELNESVIIGLTGTIASIAGIIITLLLRKRKPAGDETKAEIIQNECNEFYDELINKGNIARSLNDNETITKLENLLKKAEKAKNESVSMSLKILLESTRPKYLVELRKDGEGTIENKLKEANRFLPHQEMMIALGLENIGITDVSTQMPKVAIIGKDSATSSHYSDLLQSNVEFDEGKALIVNFTAFDKSDVALADLTRKTKRSKILLMSPFVDKNIFSTIEPEYKSPVIKVNTWIQPFALDIFRRLTQIYENLKFLSTYQHRDKIEVRLYHDYKPPIRFTLLKGGHIVSSRIFPAPMMMAGNLLTFPAETKDFELWQKISEHFDRIWNDKSDPVNLDPIDLEKVFAKEVKKFYDWIESKNLATDEYLNRIKDKIRLGRESVKQLFSVLVDTHKQKHRESTVSVD
jgi:hypothetical protein